MTAKTPSKYIQVYQGPTTAVFSYKRDGVCTGISIIHRDPRPVLFKKARRLSV